MLCNIEIKAESFIIISKMIVYNKDYIRRFLQYLKHEGFQIIFGLVTLFSNEKLIVDGKDFSAHRPMLANNIGNMIL